MQNYTYMYIGHVGQTCIAYITIPHLIQCTCSYMYMYVYIHKTTMYMYIHCTCKSRTCGAVYMYVAILVAFPGPPRSVYIMYANHFTDGTIANKSGKILVRNIMSGRRGVDTWGVHMCIIRMQSHTPQVSTLHLSDEMFLTRPSLIYNGSIIHIYREGLGTSAAIS